MEEARDARGRRWLEALTPDAKLALRMLVKSPLLSVVTGLGMAVAIAVATGIFALMAFYCSDVPVEDGDRVVTVAYLDGDDTRSTLFDYQVWKAELASIEDLAAYRRRSRCREGVRDFDRIIAKQDSLQVDYSNLERWLATLGPPPADSVAGALYRVSAENSTLFPRRASWTTMVAGNQLADLGAPELVLRLGQLYETIYNRIDYNSAHYDESLDAATQSWSAVRGSP